MTARCVHDLQRPAIRWREAATLEQQRRRLSTASVKAPRPTPRPAPRVLPNRRLRLDPSNGTLHAMSAARPSSPDHAYFRQTRERIDYKRACLTVARKLCRRAHHILRELGDQALAAPASEPQNRGGDRRCRLTRPRSPDQLTSAADDLCRLTVISAGVSFGQRVCARSGSEGSDAFGRDYRCCGI